MDLYDDLDTKQRPGQIEGWSSGVRLLQTQLALKKATVPLPPKKEIPKRSAVMAPVILLKSKKDSEPEDMFKSIDSKSKLSSTVAQSLTPSSKVFNDYSWNVIDEYDPLWPNEYEKLKEKREKADKERDLLREDRKRRGGAGNRSDTPPGKFLSGFGGRPADDEDSYNRSPPLPSNSQARSGGAAIAPPASLQESTPIIPPISNVPGTYGSGSVAAKIMAKYGFKDGQGLGKQEQGMSIALQVEKTSKRGGRIIHEKELLMPPPAVPSPPPLLPPPVKEEPTITEMMKDPSKVVLLRNMVGPGDVDEDLEPEVKDECNTKYGEVVTVAINEVSNVPAEEAVRIFVEFKRIESAIKAVVDLNGRFFGGRQVKAGFFSYDRYKSNELND